MALLVMDGVTKRFPLIGRGTAFGLHDVSLEVEPGEVVAVYGGRGSGRTTLLRLAAGVEPPDDGVIAFEGRDLSVTRDALLGRDIAFAHTRFSVGPADSALEHVAIAGLRDLRLSDARRRAMELLKRVDAYELRDFLPHQLDTGERVRVALARALMSEPRMLLIDEPTNGVDLLERDPILALIRSLAHDGLAILMTIGTSTEFAGATRALALSDGELRGALMAPPAAKVVPLRAREA